MHNQIVAARDAEIARLKAEVAAAMDQRDEQEGGKILERKRAERAEALVERQQRALAAGPAALREKGRTVRLMHPEFAAEWVEAAQEAALKGGG